MADVFQQGKVLSRGDLDIFLVNANSNPTNAYEITFALYYVDPTTSQEVLIGSPRRPPENPVVGEYYASLKIPDSANLGNYRIRWTFKQMAGQPDQQVVQEFTVTTPGLVTAAASPYSTGEQELINRLRILLRDQNPDKYYRFRPPEREKDIHKYNQVFGQIWEDYELYEYLKAGLDWWNMFPPETESLDSVSKLINFKPIWRANIIWAAIVYAATALQFNWTNEEFEYSIGGISLNLEKSSKYGALKDSAQAQLEKAAEAKLVTTKIMRGLQQSKFNQGLKTAFGPKVGRGVLAPAAFFV